jgi:hypothetical protein
MEKLLMHAKLPDNLHTRDARAIKMLMRLRISRQFAGKIDGK